MAALLSSSSPISNFETVGEPVPVRALSGDELLRIGDIAPASNGEAKRLL
jgi:hypothetical protein